MVDYPFRIAVLLICITALLFAAALPSDVRRRLRLAVDVHLSIGLRPWFGLCPKPAHNSDANG